MTRSAQSRSWTSQRSPPPQIGCGERTPSGRIISSNGALSFSPNNDVFRTVVESIVYQQLGLPAAEANIRRLKGLCRGRLTPGRIAKLRTRQIRGAGIARRKAAYLRGFARAVVAGRVDTRSVARMDEEGVVGTLGSLYGVGRWTADMVLIFALGRSDVFPTTDYGLLRAIKRTYGLRGLPSERFLARLASRWKPYRSVASLYLWKTVDPEIRNGVSVFSRCHRGREPPPEGRAAA